MVIKGYENKQSVDEQPNCNQWQNIKKQNMSKTHFQNETKQLMDTQRSKEKNQCATSTHNDLQFSSKTKASKQKTQNTKI